MEQSAKPGKETKGDQIVAYVKRQFRRNALAVTTAEIVENFDGEISDNAVKMELTPACPGGSAGTGTARHVQAVCQQSMREGDHATCTDVHPRC